MDDKYCREQGIDLYSILTSCETKVKELTNGSVIEIFSYCQKKNVNVEEIIKILSKITSTSNTAVKPCLAKIYRVIKVSKEKRRTYPEEYNRKVFSSPTETISSGNVSSEKISNPDTEKAKIESLERKLEERREMVKEFRLENKMLKRKLDRREHSVEQKAEKKARKVIVKEKVNIERMKTSMKSVLERQKATLTRQEVGMRTLKRKIGQKDLILTSKASEAQKLKRQIKDLQKSKCDLEIKNRSQREQIGELEDRIVDQDREKNELYESVRYLETLINDNETIDLKEPMKNIYSNNLVECVLNLTDLKVATKNVGPVIKEAAKLFGKGVTNIPTRQSVDRIVDRKISQTHKHVGQEAAPSKNTTLYTDETRKYGHTYESYIITDDKSNSYLLGLREMINKSRVSTADTFKQILEDISDQCNEKGDFGVGHDLLANIKNTMSDRASTEKAFNNLLTAYRKECLPHIIDNYNELSDEQQNLCGRLNSFFCGLHLLVAVADVCESSITQFERGYQTEDAGSATDEHLKRYHRAESGTLRLLRTCSKVCAVGEDEKSGASLEWKTFLGQQRKKNLIMRFRHNRFNMIFMIGGAVFYHAGDLEIFLDNVHGKSNDLLKAVSLHIKVDLYKAGAKSLGLISKFITSRLWHLIEEPGHILDMNNHFKSLVDFLDQAANDATKLGNFITGQETPFQIDIDETDYVRAKLVEQNTVDTIVLPLLQNIFIAIKELLERMIPEHLPGGKFWNPSDALLEETKSAKKHNKLPEFVFGQLDHLISYRPNASLLANEACIMYSFNKTAEWLRNLPEDEKNKYLDASRQEGRKVREAFKERTKIIQEKRLEQQRKKQEELKRKERDRIRKAEKYTNDVCFYGLWQSPTQVEEGIAALKGSKTEIESALKSQLLFRKKMY